MKPASHLGVESQQGKMYDWKATCEFCNYRYNKDQSEALNPNKWCSLECEIQDKNLSTAYLDHDNSPY